MEELQQTLRLFQSEAITLVNVRCSRNVQGGPGFQITRGCSSHAPGHCIIQGGQGSQASEFRFNATAAVVEASVQVQLSVLLRA